MHKEKEQEKQEEDRLSEHSSSQLDNLAEESSSGSEEGQYDTVNQENHREVLEDRARNQPRLDNQRHRDSGPYENVALNQDILVNSKQSMLPDSMLDFVMVGGDGGEEGRGQNIRTGLKSLRTILLPGQTSNV